jgi:hypothetical protein
LHTEVTLSVCIALLSLQFCRWVTCSCVAAMAIVGAAGWIGAMGFPECELDASCPLMSVLASIASYYFAQVSIKTASDILMCRELGYLADPIVYPACVPQSTRFSVVTSCFLLAHSFISHVLLANHHRDQGAGKLRLGSHWLDWALNNRIECLWVNSCLRGHLAGFMSIDAVVAVARVLRVMRVSDLLCGRPTSCESRCCWWLRFWKLSFVSYFVCANPSAYFSVMAHASLRHCPANQSAYFKTIFMLC